MRIQKLQVDRGCHQRRGGKVYEPKDYWNLQGLSSWKGQPLSYFFLSSFFCLYLSPSSPFIASLHYRPLFSSAFPFLILQYRIAFIFSCITCTCFSFVCHFFASWEASQQRKHMERKRNLIAASLKGRIDKKSRIKTRSRILL